MGKGLSRPEYKFAISLSVLNHLGRNLYRSFATVLGEAISNSWDADATKVNIYIDKTNNNLCIKDNGEGMTSDDFQYKFLKIGYTKRKERKESRKGRPYIGRKGIGKLALLSCAKKITIISKTKGSEYTGGVIDNGDLDKAIKRDIEPDEYELKAWDRIKLKKYTKGHEKGTIILFEDIERGIRSSLEFIKKIIALYFKFSLIDKNFEIFLGDKDKITYKCLDELAEKTEFLWKINNLKDPYIKRLEKQFSPKEKKTIPINKKIKGFIASVERPRDLKIMSTDEKIGIDLFVNGRLRERRILDHISTARVVDNYLYGQIHFDDLDDKKDRFTSSREGIAADDQKYKEFLETIKNKIINKVLDDWDKWRIKHREEGDSENKRLPKRERKAKSLFDDITNDFVPTKEDRNRKKIDAWIYDLSSDARFNFASYGECFVSENLIRKYIKARKIKLSDKRKDKIKQFKKHEKESKGRGGVSIKLRRNEDGLSYLSMDELAEIVEKKGTDRLKEASLIRDGKAYKPIRDALAHTALLTDPAKRRLTTVYDNIKSRVQKILYGTKKRK